MNLSKHDKQAIVALILADVKKPSQEEIENAMQKALVAAMSPACKRTLKSNPDCLKTAVFSPWDYQLEWSVDLVVGDVKGTKEVLKEFSDKAKQTRGLRGKLEAALVPIRTRKQFIDQFPEFSKYAPSEASKCTTLPAVANLVADLVNAGWVQTISKGQA